MKYGRYFVKLIWGILMLCIIALSFSTATYAWFTSNRIVRTDKVVSQSNTDMVKLMVSGTGGDAFTGKSKEDITRVNSTDANKLMPVSTADLKNFVSQNGSVSDMAVSFEKAKESDYYHGQIFLRADAVNHEGEKLALYFDEPEDMGPLFKNTKGSVLNAIRLGITIDDVKTYLFRVSDAASPNQKQAANTILNGEILGKNQVIDSSGNTFRAVTDPSVLLKDYMVDPDGTTNGSKKPLLEMDLNRIYKLDIYVYLEGCDPDCTDAVELGSLDFYLAFYGILVGEDI